ncbi:hypothetical protein ADILRU_1066 [Leifsonia rubra CMS 76R]|nr:hypothetical protein ADILRU_1066 [Leifsonia rubra CMS 76R]
MSRTEIDEHHFKMCRIPFPMRASVRPYHVALVSAAMVLWMSSR